MYSRNYQREWLEPCTHLGNPADLISWVTQQEKLVNLQLWWQGPQWLREMTKDVPGECRMRSLVAPTCVPINRYVKRFLSFAKFVRVIAYVHCFWHNAHYPRKKKRGQFKASDLKTALYVCLHMYMVQHTVSHRETADLKSSWYVKRSELHTLSSLRQAWNASGGWKAEEFLIAIWESASNHTTFKTSLDRIYSKGTPSETTAWDLSTCLLHFEWNTGFLEEDKYNSQYLTNTHCASNSGQLHLSS